MHVYLGSFTPSSTVYAMFNTQDLAGAPVAGSSLAVSVYKNASTTETTTGVTLTAGYDSKTGLNHVAIDTSSDGTFYADGSECFVWLSAGTVDGVSVVGKVIAQFSIAAQATVPVNVTQFGGSNITSASGRPEVNVSHIAGSAVSTTTAQLGVNVVAISTDATAADNAEAFFDGTGYAGTNNVIPVVTTTTTATNLTTNNDKTGYRLSATGVDDVWDEVASGHLTTGTYGALLAPARCNTATAGAATTITLDASASATDDIYNGSVITLVGGTGAGQGNIITDYVGATKVATVKDAWVTNPASGSIFVIYAAHRATS